MWRLGKPALDSALQDIDKIIRASGNRLDDTIKPKMQYVIRMYDQNKGSIASSVLNRFTCVEGDLIHNMYGSKTYEGQELYYIREELFNGVDLCPLCGINPPSQLDHQMPKSQYKPLSLCRLNLVPTCGVCNNKKRAKPYDEFLHPYYVDFPNGIVFLIVNIHVNVLAHRFSWYYSLDYSQFPKDSSLKTQIEKQVEHIKLLRRLKKESHRFVADTLGCTNFKSRTVLKGYLSDRYNYCLRMYGRNDWRTVILYGLYISDKIGVEEVNWYIGRIRPVNGGFNV